MYWSTEVDVKKWHEASHPDALLPETCLQSSLNLWALPSLTVSVHVLIPACIGLPPAPHSFLLQQ